MVDPRQILELAPGSVGLQRIEKSKFRSVGSRPRPPTSTALSRGVWTNIYHTTTTPLQLKKVDGPSLPFPSRLPPLVRPSRLPPSVERHRRLFSLFFCERITIIRRASRLPISGLPSTSPSRSCTRRTLFRTTSFLDPPTIRTTSAHPGVAPSFQ